MDKVTNSLVANKSNKKNKQNEQAKNQKQNGKKDLGIVTTRLVIYKNHISCIKLSMF